MYPEGFEQWFKMNKNFTSPFNDMNKTFVEICRKTAQQNLELMGQHLSRVSDQLIQLSHVEKPEELLSLQKKCLSENISASMEYLQKIGRMAMDNAQEITQLCGSVVKEQQQNAAKAGSKMTEKEKM